MPPQARITKEMAVEAAFALARERGIACVNARAVAQRLGCSTQPVMYHFKTIEALKKAVYQKADAYHTACIMAPQGENPLLAVGLDYIRFAQTEKHLFQLLFQSNEFANKSLSELIGAEETAPILSAVSEMAGVPPQQAQRIFQALFLFVHGYASMLANNAMHYDEETISADLESILIGMIYAAKEEQP